LAATHSTFSNGCLLRKQWSTVPLHRGCLHQQTTHRRPPTHLSDL
jgi:hypothetical protein